MDTHEFYVDPSIPPFLLSSIQLRPFTHQVVLELAWRDKKQTKKRPLELAGHLSKGVCAYVDVYVPHVHERLFTFIYLYYHLLYIYILFSAWKHTGMKLTGEKHVLIIVSFLLMQLDGWLDSRFQVPKFIANLHHLDSHDSISLKRVLKLVLWMIPPKFLDVSHRGFR